MMYEDLKLECENQDKFRKTQVSVLTLSIFIGNPGSLCVTRDVTQVNIENIWGEVKVWKFAGKWQ